LRRLPRSHRPQARQRGRAGHLPIRRQPALKAETGDSKAIGFVWESERAPGLHAGMTYWEASSANRVTVLGAQDDRRQRGRVSRLRDPWPGSGGQPGRSKPSASCRSISARCRFAGLDFNVDYRWRTSLGDFTPSLSLTRTTRYDAALLHGQAPKIASAGRRGWLGTTLEIHRRARLGPRAALRRR
jgi:hypothetical protein